MLKKIIFAENALDADTWEEFEVEDICEFLAGRFETFPDTARIYHNQVAQSHDVTPTDAGGIDKLNELDGVFYVVVYPGEVIIPYIIYAVIAIAAYYYAKSQIPSPSTRSVQNESPNNELSERTNRARPKARIPDIYGTVRSTPDLLALPYSVYENNIEVEYSYMCVGRGAYEVPAGEVKDETTPISEIGGSSVEVFAPDTSPNSGDAPQLRIGDVITEPVYSADRTNAVNGQVLKPTDLNTFVGANNVVGIASLGLTTFSVNLSGGDDFTDYFKKGDSIELIDFDYTDGVTTVNLDGTYVISSMTAIIMFLEDAATVNPDWLELANYPSNRTGLTSPTIEPAGGAWAGPFVIDAPNLEKVFSNFVALNGLYIDTGVSQIKIDVELRVGLQPLDVDGTPLAAESFFDVTLEGSTTLKSTRASTLKIDFGVGSTGYEGRFQVRARRITGTFTGGNVVDEVKWRDVYAMSNVSENDFGDVTTVHSVTQATAGALVAKSRKLNMLVTRKLPQRISGSTFTTELYATNRADEILSAICLDPYIGNRDVAEIDFDSIYDTVAEAEEYFGLEKAVEFNYTFDADNLSFEESVAALANAIFCTAYRFGNVIKLNFEKETDDSVLLFNHRNKLPGSEKRTVRFGNQDDNDGVELEYVDPSDDALVTLYLPNDQARKPKKVETVGVRNKIQAYWQAWRIWNKIQFQNIATEFDATQEADLLVLNDRVLVADNTRPGTQDGEVVSQNGLELELSQPVTFEATPTYTIFLQHTDGTTESLPVVAGSDSYRVILGSAPKAPLSLDASAFAKATYQIVSDESEREQAFLVTEKDSLSNFTSRVTAINYDSEYYDRDKDYENGLINEDGELNLAGDTSFRPRAGSFLLSEFPVSVTILAVGAGAEIRYSKTAMPTSVTEGTEYTGPVDVADGETLYAKGFTTLNPMGGGGSTGTYTSVPNLDFRFADNSQHIPLT